MYELDKQEAEEVKDWIEANYDVHSVRVVVSRGYAVYFEYDLGGYRVEAEIHESEKERQIPIE